MFNSQGEVKIADFGVCAQLKDTLDVTKSYVGTVCYMSPERIEGKDHSLPSDIWSLGITILENALGRFPYPEPNSDGTVEALQFWDLMNYITSNPAPVIPESFSQDFRDFISKCLVKDPTKRATASELLQHPWIVSSADPYQFMNLI